MAKRQSSQGGRSGETVYGYTQQEIDQAIVGGVELTERQKEIFKKGTGTDINWVLFEYRGYTAARNVDSSYINILSATWCW